MTEVKHRSVRGSVRSLLMISLNLDEKTFLGPNFPPVTILPLSLYHKDIIKDNVNVQEYLACIKSMQKVHWITVPISANGEMNSVKIPGQQTLDLKRSASITSDSHRKQTLKFQEDSIWYSAHAQ